MKLAFMGSDPIALPMLEHLYRERPFGFSLELVYTQPDRRAGRGMKLKANAIKDWAVSKGIPVRQPAKCGVEEADYLKEEGVGQVLVMAYGQILPRCILEATPNKVLNVHASLLPRLRGASPIHTAMAIGLKQTGVSLMEIIPKLDAGPVADQEPVVIHPEDGIGDLLLRMGEATVPLVVRSLDKLAKAKLTFTEQDPAKVTYCRILDKSDCYLDFGAGVAELVNRIRAFQPWPGTSFICNEVEIRIHAAVEEVDFATSDEPGTVRVDSGGIRIACRDGWLRPLVLQRPGGKPLSAEAFFRGFPIEDGLVVLSREMRPLEGSGPFPYRKK